MGLKGLLHYNSQTCIGEAVECSEPPCYNHNFRRKYLNMIHNTYDEQRLLCGALCRYSCSYEPGYDISIPDGVTSAGDWNQHGTAVAGDDVVAECIELIESRKPA